MRIAIVRNTPQGKVLRRRGRQNREFYRESDIQAAREALAAGGHDVAVFEGDATLIDRLERTYAGPDGAFPDDVFVFNLAYGIQGEGRYTHLPALLEMLGLPYLCSGPRSHTICLDKYLTKVLIDRAGLPTPPFQLLTAPADPLDEGLDYPLVVKPQFESTSFGMRLVGSRQQLDEAVSAIARDFNQPALAEAFVDGREVNCGLIGNAPVTPLPVLEIDFGPLGGLSPSDHRRLVTFEAKRDRTVGHICPANLPADLTKAVQNLAVRTFQTLGCCDCARVDFRIDAAGRPWILELNSMAAIHPDGSYYHAARTLGWAYTDMIDRLLRTALARYGFVQEVP